MRAQGRRHRSHEEDEESAFVSMTDMTVGFLFVVMILLAFFASEFKNTQTVALDVYDRLQQKYDVILQDRDHLKVETDRQAVEIEKLKAHIAEMEKSRIDPLEVYLSRVAQARRQLLERLRDGLKIDFPDLQVQLNEQSDALRFQGDGLFVQGGSIFTAGKSEVVKRIAQRLNEILPCYTLGTRYVPSVRPVEGSGTTWMPEIFSAQVLQALAAMPIEELNDLHQTMERQVDQPGSTVTIAGESVGVTPDRVASVKVIHDQKQSTEKESVQPEQLAAKTGPLILDAGDNYDELGWSASTQGKMGERTASGC